VVLLQWAVLQRKSRILDVEGVEKMHFINVTIDVPVVVFLMQNAESIPGLNGTRRCKSLQLLLVQ
jgi:hypothetical protein